MPVSDGKNFRKITLEDIDQAVKDWFDKTVDAHVRSSNTDRKKVIVSWAAGERAITSRQKTGVRDENGVLILPVISIRRSSMEPARDQFALGTETARITFSKKISQKTNNLANLWTGRPFYARNPAKPVVYEVTTVPFPDRSLLTYEVQIQTQYITQMNTILEKMVHELDIGKSFVAPMINMNKHAQVNVDFEKRKKIDGSYVVGFFDSTGTDNGNLEEFTDQERIIRWSTSIKVPAALQLSPEGEVPSLKTERTSFGVDFGEERINFVDDPDEIDKIFGNNK